MNINLDDAINLTPAEFARFLFDHTDKNGVLCMPKAFGLDGIDGELPEGYDEFAMNWDEEKLAQLIADFEALYAGLTEISKIYAKIEENEEIATYSRRLCKLLSLRAPQIVVQNEARNLIGSMALHEFATTK